MLFLGTLCYYMRANAFFVWYLYGAWCGALEVGIA